MTHFKRIACILIATLFGVVFSCSAQINSNTSKRKKYVYKKRTAEEKARYFTKKMVDSLTVSEGQEDSLFQMNIVVSQKFDSLKRIVNSLSKKERSAGYRSIYAYRDSCMRAILPRKEFLKFLDLEREKYERKKSKQENKKRVVKKNPIEIIPIDKPSEIRVGSPYSTCQYKFKGTSIQLPKSNWQNKYAWSLDKKFLVLIQYNFIKNDPGFLLYIIDTKMDTVKITKRIKGFVKTISVENKVIRYNKFLFDAEKSSTGTLCCYLDEEYPIIQLTED